MKYQRQAFFISIILLVSAGLVRATDNLWTTSFPFGGNIHGFGLVVDPSNPSVVYATPNWRGIYKSFDGGANWFSITDNRPLPFDRSSIRFFAIQPGTGALFLASHNFTRDARVFRSTDGGSWTQLNNGITGSVQVLAFDAASTSTIYAGTTNAGLFKTTDGGANWAATGVATLPPTEIRSLVLDYAQPQTLYLGTSGNGIYKSTDGGANWVNSNNNVAMTRVESIRIDPSNNGVIYAADGHFATGRGIFKSTDAGASWTKLPPTLDFDSPGYLIEIDPTNPNTIFVASRGAVFRSTDGGAGWSSAPVSLSQVTSLALNPAAPQSICAGTGDGVFRSADGGQSWSFASNGIRAINFSHSRSHSLAIDRSNPSFIYAGTFNRSNTSGHRSTDSGQTWSRIFFPNNGLSSIATHQGSPGTVFGFHNDIFKSTDRGLSWANSSGGAFCCFIAGDVVIHSSNPQIIYMAGASSNESPDGVRKSTDGGATWTPVNVGLTNPKIHTLSVDPNNGEVVYAGTRANSGPASGLFKTTNGGANWVKLTTGLPPEFNPNQVAIHPLNSNLLYMGAETTNGGVYRSTDGGASWVKVLNENVNSVAVDPGNTGRVYVGTWNTGGFYVSNNGGASWSPMNAGLPFNPGIESIQVDPADPNHIYIGTTAGVWEINLSPNAIVDPNQFQSAIAGLGPSAVIDFQDIDASPVNNSTAGRMPFDGSFYADRGAVFSNPNSLALFVAPGGLFWNASNSLSVSNFPFEGGSNTDDDLVVTFTPPVRAIGFTLVDNGSQREDEFVQFIDTQGDVIEQVAFPSNHGPFRGFIGCISQDRPIAKINIVEAANDGDDLAYDDFIFVPAVNLISAAIDIKPGGFPNSINPGGNGSIPVAILSTPGFDATTVDPQTVKFGPNKASPTSSAREDVDGDGDADLVLHFETRETGIKCGDTEGSLTGKTSGGDFITGSDSINTVGCKPLQVTVSDMGPEIGVVFGSEPFVFHPENTDEILSVGGRSGILKTTSGGSSWFGSNAGMVDGSGMNALPVSLRRDPNNPSTVYAATAQDGLYRSTNFGSTWTPIGNLPNLNLRDCGVHPSSSNIVYALTTFIGSEAGFPGPLFRSTDGGASFAEVGNGLPDLDNARRLQISQANPNHVYIAAFGTLQGIYKSTDGGLNFARLTAAPFSPFELALHPSQADTMLALANIDSSTGLFRSTDGGASFTEITATLPTGNRFNVIAFDPQIPSKVYLGGMDGLFLSTNGGASFASFGKLEQDMLGPFGVIGIGIDPEDSNVIYINTSLGNFKTVNAGKSFREINSGWLTSQINHLAFDSHNSPSLYAATFNTVGLLRTGNRGKQYEIVGKALPNIQVSAVAVAATDPNFIVATTSGGIFRSVDGGRSWAAASFNTGLVFLNPNSRIAIDPNNPHNIYAVTPGGPFPGFYRSTDKGMSFSLSNTGLAVPFLGALAIDPASPNVIYVGAFNGNRGVFKSTDGGLSFTQTGQANGNVGEIIIDPQNTQKVYVGLRGGPLRVRRSQNGGATFTTADVGLSGNVVRGFAVDPRNPSRLFVWIRAGGVFISEDGADSWSVLDSGETLRLSKAGRGAMAIHPKNTNLIYVGGASLLEIEIKP